MVAGSFTWDAASNIAVDRLWKAGILDIHSLMPKIAPEHVKSVEIVEGDGGAGTIKKFTFTEAVKGFGFVKDKVEVLDNENHVFKYSVIEGGHIGVRLKSYSFELKLDAASDGSSVGRVRVDYETLNDVDLSEEEKGQIMHGVLAMMKAVEGFLLANPESYA